ncbi:chemotaxis protein CheA [Zoogloea sp.]|uniref:chemotaxis protein CheA n=1 Tax=Zoogloea sp. TaxID=49181 RepID=UPI0035AE613E
MDIDQAIPTFLLEARELLEQMEDGLLQIENGEGDGETVNAIFRAAHTIKGSAGIFGFDEVVGFTHTVENVLDRVRSNELAIDRPLAELLLASGDHIGTLLQRVADKAHGHDPVVNAIGHDLLGQLARFTTAITLPAPTVASDVTPATTLPAATGGNSAATGNWHVSLRFSREVLQHGMDPLSFIRYLGSLGEIEGIVTLQDALPALGELDPEACYLGFEISLKSEASHADIDGTFDFVRDDATIHILPPHSPLQTYADMLTALTSEPAALGEALVRCGTLDAAELERALAPAPAATTALVPVTAEEAPALPAVIDAALPATGGKPPRDSGRAKTLRVDADKLDKLINLVGELVIAGAGANMIAGQLKARRMLEATSTMARLIEEVRDSTLNLRMVQIGETFNRFQRVVRDVARDLGKDIRLVINGAETELDKTMVEKIGDPLMHLVRNAMDHGIEPAELRVARGKPAQGTIRLDARHDSGGVLIEVSDDGNGLNRERILKKAIEKGLVGPQQNLSDEDVYKLIFAPGFSTAEQLSNISGRGVGMDVVKKNIEALHGSIEIDSAEGQGSTMRIRLPLTLAIIDGFLVGVGDASFVIPLDQVVECIELPAAERQSGQRRDYLNQRGQILPYTRLRDALDLPVGKEARHTDRNLVVVQYGGKRAGLVVDSLHGEIQTVIKPLGRVFSRVQGISGSTILGSGAVALILDVPRLLQQVTDRAAA